MENFKGTKGDWILVSVNDHPTHEGEQVAFIQTATHAFDVGAVEVSFLNRETFKANAQLIAHAPEMLEALKECKTMFNKGKRLTTTDMAIMADEITDLLTRATTI